MPRNELLLEFRACYERLEAARLSGEELALRHAERNFHATAESLARLVPRLVATDETPHEAISA